MAGNRETPRAKPLPIRTCISCREPQTKGSLVRVVRTPAGRIEVDPTGRKAGRGAYLCQRRSCWENATKRNRLEYALKTKVSLEDRATLEEFIQTLPTEIEKLPSPVLGVE